MYILVILILTTGNVFSIETTSKQNCESIKTELQQQYAKVTGAELAQTFVQMRCFEK